MENAFITCQLEDLFLAVNVVTVPWDFIGMVVKNLCITTRLNKYYSKLNIQDRSLLLIMHKWSDVYGGLNL